MVAEEVEVADYAPLSGEWRRVVGRQTRIMQTSDAQHILYVLIGAREWERGGAT